MLKQPTIVFFITLTTRLCLSLALPVTAPSVITQSWDVTTPGGARYNLPPAPPACTKELRGRIDWGASTSSYQIEGGWNEGGKSLSVWDVWADIPGKVYQNATGRVACDHYHRWRDDVLLMKQLGMKHYRLSLSWPRIVPGGTRGSPVNPEGVRFYKNLLSSLTAAGIAPMVTLFHWDMPQALQDKYGGLLSRNFVDDFAYYADVAFKELGQYVEYWVMLNEPLVTCGMGYLSETFPPGVTADYTAFLRCGHNQLLAHAKAVQLYRQKYRAAQKGKISLAVPGWFGIPYNTASAADIAATEAMMQFRWAWMFDPVVFGDYPAAMKDYYSTHGAILPAFSYEEQQMLKGSVDYMGINVYTSRYIAASGDPDAFEPWMESFQNASGVPLGADSDVAWLKVTPGALKGVINWLSSRYGKNLPIRVTENGVPVPDESSKPVVEALQDTFRLSYYSQYLNELCLAVAQDGANVQGYYAWSLMDNFEWADGYKPRFGVVYVDYANHLQRLPKQSAWWLSKHFFTASKRHVHA